MNKNFVINHLKKHHSNLKIIDKNSVFNNNYIVKYRKSQAIKNDKQAKIRAYTFLISSIISKSIPKKN